jgi:hypothetical protein
MTSERSRFALSPTARRLVRSYGLLILIAIGFLLMAMMIREKPKTVPAESSAESFGSPRVQEVPLWH